MKVIAEYSLDEDPQTIMPTYYLTYQKIHGKQLINSDRSVSPEAPIRQSIRNIEDPQTLPTLRALGADTVIIHGIEHGLSVPGLTLIDYEESRPSTSNPAFGDVKPIYPIAVYHIDSGPRAGYVLALESGYVYPKKLTAVSYDYVGGNGATFKLVGLPGGARASRGQFCFEARSESGRPEAASIKQGNTVLWSGILSAEWQPVSFVGATDVTTTLKVDSTDKTSFMMRGLGCGQ